MMAGGRRLGKQGREVKLAMALFFDFCARDALFLGKRLGWRRKKNSSDLKKSVDLGAYLPHQFSDS